MPSKKALSLGTCHRPLCLALTTTLLAPLPPAYQSLRIDEPRFGRVNAATHAGAPTHPVFFVAPLLSTLKCLHGDLHGFCSARQLSRSVFQLSTSQTSTAGRAGGRSSSPQHGRKGTPLISMAGRFPRGLISTQKWGPTPREAPGIGWLLANPMRQRLPAWRLRSGARSSHWASCANPTRNLRFLTMGHTCSCRCIAIHGGIGWLAGLVRGRAPL